MDLPESPMPSTTINLPRCRFGARGVMRCSHCTWAITLQLVDGPLADERRRVSFAERHRVSLRRSRWLRSDTWVDSPDRPMPSTTINLPRRWFGCEQGHALLALYVGPITGQLDMPGDAVPLQLIDEPLAAESQHPRGLLLIVPGALQRLGDHFALEFLGGHFQGFAGFVRCNWARARRQALRHRSSCWMTAPRAHAARRVTSLRNCRTLPGHGREHSFRNTWFENSIGPRPVSRQYSFRKWLASSGISSPDVAQRR